MSHTTRRYLSAMIIAVLVTVGIVGGSANAGGATRYRGVLRPYARTSSACRTAILDVWGDLLRGGIAWRRDLFAFRPLVAGTGAPTAAHAASTIARSRGLMPACDVETVSYAARSLALVGLFGGPSALAHLRTQWSTMSSAQRATFEQHLLYGEPSSISLSVGSITILAHRPASETVRVALIEHLTGATTTSDATVSVVRLTGRWYVSSISNLGMNVG